MWHALGVRSDGKLNILTNINACIVKVTIRNEGSIHGKLSWKYSESICNRLFVDISSPQSSWCALTNEQWRNKGSDEMPAAGGRHHVTYLCPCSKRPEPRPYAGGYSPMISVEKGQDTMRRETRRRNQRIKWKRACLAWHLFAASYLTYNGLSDVTSEVP